MLKPTLMTAVPAILDRVRDGVLKKEGPSNFGWSHPFCAVWMCSSFWCYSKIHQHLSWLIDWLEGGYLKTDSPMPRGEILIGGPNVTVGYFKNDAKTDEVYKVDEKGMRWFYTGDIGQFHSDGCLEIIDRKKDIVKLQHGEYVSLGKVKTALIVSPYVDSRMLYADPFISYCVALVVASQPTVEGWAKKQGIAFVDFADLCQKKETVKEIHVSLVKAAKQARLEKFEIPAKINLLSEPWTPESGLVTTALKIKRAVIRKTFSEDLSELYRS